jgi:hypothetical protein
MSSHQKETPPEGGALEIENLGIDLGNHLIDAMKAWADRQGTGAVNALVPIVALRTALVSVLNRFPSERRRLYADDFIRSLNRSFQRSSN